jgi:Ca2+-binding EF-hand superfamily protein
MYGAPRQRVLTDQQQNIINAAFSGFNTDNNDMIDREEMKAALVQIDPTASEEEIDLLVDTIDNDDSGDVSLEEFRTFLTQKLLGLMDDEMMHKFEATFDYTMSGVITSHDLQRMLKLEGEFPLSDAEANEFVELAETQFVRSDGERAERVSNGLIEYRPFLKWLKEDHED